MRSTLVKLALAIAPMTAAPFLATPAIAQSKLGVAVADVAGAMRQSNAYKLAQTQMETTYKANIDQFKTRKTAIEADLQAKKTALEAAVKANGAKPATPAMQTQYDAFQQAQAQGQAELQRIGQPIALAQAYVEEQFDAKVGDAIKSAMAQAKVDLVIAPQAAISYAPATDITPMVVQQFNTLVPSVSITPPAGWRPGQDKAAPGAAPAAAAPAAKPTGR